MNISLYLQPTSVTQCPPIAAGQNMIGIAVAYGVYVLLKELNKLYNQILNRASVNTMEIAFADAFVFTKLTNLQKNN